MPARRKNLHQTAFSHRQSAGSSIAEFGPALGILLLSIFFPLLDLVMLGFSYCQCMTLNSLQSQKAAEMSQVQASSPTGPIFQGLPSAWQQTGMGAFVKLTDAPTTTVIYQNADSQDKFVIVSTSFSVQPFLNIPLIPGVPGLSAPTAFTISSKRVVEDPSS
jgi:hypothetical protein